MKYKKSDRRIQRDENHQYVRIWKSKGFVLTLLVLFVLLAVSVTKEAIRKIEMNYEIEKMESEVARLQHRNIEMDDILALLNTDTMQEKEARVKLGLQSEGERVVMLPGRRTEKEIILPDSDKIRYIPINDYQSNPEKWFYFFWDKIDKPVINNT
ncbi:MAG: septum formation initiator family protein [Candidatus Kerfeldbacteria bacterium]